MSRRNLLTTIVLVQLIIGLIFACYPFVKSLSPSEKAKNDAIKLIQISSLEKGVVNKFYVGSRVLFILQPTEDQSRSIDFLTQHVWNKEITSYNEDLGAYVYWGQSTRWGCELEQQPPHEKRLFDSGPIRKWMGGYFDWRCEMSYDYAGRAIRTWEYTYNGFNASYDNLYSPTFLKKQRGNTYAVSMGNR